MTKKVDAEKLKLHGQLPVPSGKPEVVDNNGNVFALATENFVLNALRGLSPCVLATVQNLQAIYDNGQEGIGATLTSAASESFILDDVTPTTGDRVLVKNQDDERENGIYVISSLGSSSMPWVLTRTLDFDTPGQMERGKTVAVAAGSQNKSTLWMLTSVVLSVGSDNIDFSNVDSNVITNVIGTSNQIVASVSNGVVTLSLSENLVLPGTGAVKLPVGTTEERPVLLQAGMIRFNTSL